MSELTAQPTSEKLKVESKIEAQKLELNKQKNEMNRLMQYLGNHGALSEYNALLERYGEEKRKLERLVDFENLYQEFEDRSQANELEMSKENIKATDYLKLTKKHREKINDLFRSLAKRIWPSSTSGLLVQNDTGDNQIRFEIEPKIQSDSSDGVGETKIFCFDMTVLLHQQNHHMNCLIHDNRLYPGIDPRQRSELFRIAHEKTKEAGMQYIAALNQDNIDSMKSEMSEKEYSNLISNNTILELTDDSDAGKLLGVTIELGY